MKKIFADIKEIFFVLWGWIKGFFLKIKNLGAFFKSIKSYWILYVFVTGLFISSNVFLVIGNNYSYETKLENLCNQIAETSRENDYKTVALNVEQNEVNGRTLIDINKSYKFNGPYINPQYSLNNSLIGINAKLNETFNVKYSCDSDYRASSIIFPNAIYSEGKELEVDGVKEKYYKMQDIELYFRYKKPLSLATADWCIISSNMAENKAKELNVPIENMIGNKIDVSFISDNKEVNEKWTIIGIYDSNLGEAPRITSMFGDFMMSWVIFAGNTNYNLKGLSLTIDMHYSIKNNCNILKHFLGLLDFYESKYIFQSSKDFTINYFLNNSLMDVCANRNNGFFNTYNICSLILYFTLILIVGITYFNFKKTKTQQPENTKSYIFLIFIMTIIFAVTQIVTLCLQSSNLMSSVQVYHCSQSSIISFAYEAILIYLLLIKLINYRFSRKKGEIKNEKQD